MTFGESIKICFSKYADFNGRATRSEYWWWTLFALLVSSAASMVGDLPAGLFSLAIFLPSIAVTARRLHDINRSGWWQLVALIPLVGWILILYWLVQASKEINRFDASPGQHQRQL